MERRKGRKDSGKDLLFQRFAKESLAPCAGERLQGHVLSFSDELYLCPLPDLTGLKVLRAGLDLGTVKEERFEPSHALALFLAESDVLQSINLPADSSDIAGYLHGESISCDPSLSGWVLVLVDHYSIGWGKASGGVLKNHYPKGLRKQY